MSELKETHKEKPFDEAFREEIEMQIEDINQINIMTAVSSNLTGKVQPEAQDLLSFIAAKAGDFVERKALDMTKLRDGFKPLKRPDIKKSAEDLNATVLVRTIFELDGDILLLLRGQHIDNQGKQIVSLDSAILAAHQANVNVAVENWHYLIRTALEALKLIRDLAKP
jgi:hypothetical protein